MSTPSSSVQFGTQWTHPSDILSVLQIIGGDVIRRALAQLSGSYLTPVPFSFGWVAYSFNFMFAVGDKKLMPEPDYPGVVINAKSGYTRDNRSWVLGRVLRDYDYWMPKQVKDKLEQMIDSAWKADAKDQGGTDPLVIPKRKRPGLCIAVFHTSPEHRAGEPANDWVFYSGILTVIFQLGVASIPCALYGQWSVLMITVLGTLLALASGALPQWRAEKWQCRRGTKTVILTEGNGSQHAIVVIGAGDALDLEDLASSAGDRAPLSLKVYAAFLAVLWLGFLITVSGVKQNTWFVLAVGGIGMLQNTIVAGAQRRPEAFGLHLKFHDVIGHYKAMDALMELENKYPRVGASLVKTFFPGRLWKEEQEFWEKATIQT